MRQRLWRLLSKPEYFPPVPPHDYTPYLHHDASCVYCGGFHDSEEHGVSDREWRSIETAPKDGTTVLAYFPLEGLSDDWERVMPVYYRQSMEPRPWIFAGRAASSYGSGPTHWMPLPPAPSRQKEDAHV